MLMHTVTYSKYHNDSHGIQYVQSYLHRKEKLYILISEYIITTEFSTVCLLTH